MQAYRIEKGGMHWLFRKCRKKIQILAGGFGNGKTAGVCVRMLEICMDYPGCNVLIARATYPKLNDTIRKEFIKWCPANAVKRYPTKDDNTLIFKNGSTVNFRYIQQRGKASVDGNTTSNLLSATYDAIAVDQMEDPEIQHKDFLDLMGRLRGSTPYKGSDPTMPMTGPRFMFLTANPTANWFYKLLVRPYHRFIATGVVSDELICDPRTGEPIIEVFEGSTYENANNLEADFIEGLEASYKGQMRNRFLLGEWAAYEGLVYPEFRADVHMIPHQDILDMIEDAGKVKSPLNNLECFDFGIASPSCYLHGFTDYEGRVFWSDGFYEPGGNIDRIGSEIIRIRGENWFGMEYDNPIWADPAIFKRTVTVGDGKSTDTVAKLLTSRFELPMKRGQNDVLSGIAKVSEYMTIRPRMHYKTGSEGPMMYFSDKLQFVQEEIQSYFWKKSSEGERLDEPRDVNDHAMDAIKYGVSRLPSATIYNFRKPVITPEHMQWQEHP